METAMRIELRVLAAFRQRSGAGPAHLVRAPGRVNLIGEHTDYNDGFVMSLAIDRAVWARQQAGHTLRGFEAVVAGDVPIGAGLSSSAAWELAAARAFSITSGISWSASQMAVLAQRAENQWVGVNCGITENDRTLRAAQAMRRGDAGALGALMTASHASLRDDFRVSSAELNCMVTCAEQLPGCLGARMTGAGFGGCAVALVRAEAADEFSHQVAAAYQTATALTPQVYVCRATDGAALVASQLLSIS
jgi:galactokinase